MPTDNFIRGDNFRLNLNFDANIVIASLLDRVDWNRLPMVRYANKGDNSIGK